MFTKIKKQGHVRGLLSEYKYQLLILCLITTVSIGSCLMTSQPKLVINTRTPVTVIRPSSPAQNAGQIQFSKVDTPLQEVKKAIPRQDLSWRVAKADTLSDEVDTLYEDVVQVVGIKKKESVMKCQTSSTFSSTQLRQTGSRSLINFRRAGSKRQGQSGSRSLTDFGKYACGVTNTSNGTAGRGSRPDGTAVFVDGVRVTNAAIAARPRPVKWPWFWKRWRKQKQVNEYTYMNEDSYASLTENEYKDPALKPLSTFSIDVDNASYTNARQFLNQGILPPKDAIRIEEFVNYFDYKYPVPTGKDPFAIDMEVASTPWNSHTKVVRIGIKGFEMDKQQLPKSNLVFLIDVSGSMMDKNKLPLVKKSLKLLVDQMRTEDQVSLVVYAGAAGIVLPATSCANKSAIRDAIDRLEAGGSTAGGQGLTLAYNTAKSNFIPNGNNRIILVTDGDFNVGLSSDDDMKRLVEEKRKEGIFLTACGFGMGNLKDSKLETIADHGNGNYFYIDNYNEAKKIFVSGLTGTLMTIAKDVKMQVEFNPRLVKAYRLIGYENRIMAAQDFDNDIKDAGELGAGHTVTALYEIVPVGSNMDIPGFKTVKEGENSEPDDTILAGMRKPFGDELMHIRMRYKKPDSDKSELIEQLLSDSEHNYSEASDNFRFACGVTVYAMMLRDSKFKGNSSYELADKLVRSTRLNEENGYKKELLALIEKARSLSVPK